MVKRTLAALLAASLLSAQMSPSPAMADNQMGYKLLSASQASGLPRSGGALGMDVGRGELINSGGMAFELLKVNSVRRGSAGEQAGFSPGDQIIAVDGNVFPSVAAFAAYVGSVAPGGQISVDYIPSGGGPQQAQRVTVTLGAGGRAAPSAQAEDQAQPKGLSTGAKLAIGVGAAALFGCYKLGCFSHKAKPGQASPQQPAGTSLQQ